MNQNHTKTPLIKLCLGTLNRIGEIHHETKQERNSNRVTIVTSRVHNSYDYNTVPSITNERNYWEIPQPNDNVYYHIRWGDINWYSDYG